MVDQNHTSSNRGLVRMRSVASGLLLLAAAVFLATLWVDDSQVWVGYVRAAAEAAMVGGLADWFAVTALFRHPLGIPIPHTAIIAKRKDQIGRSLGAFVRDNFLSDDVVAQRIAEADFASRLGKWLSNPTSAQSISRHLVTVTKGLTDVIDDETIGNELSKIVTERLEEAQVSHLAAKFAESVIEKDYHQQLFDSALSAFEAFLSDNSQTFRAKFAAESPWWVPGLIDNRVYEKIYSAVTAYISEILADPDHRLRQDFDRKLRKLARDLEDSEQAQARAQAWKIKLLETDAVYEWTKGLWDQAKSAIIDAASDPQSQLRGSIGAALVQTGERINDSAELRDRINAWSTRAAIYVVSEYSEEVSSLIEGTVASWDTKQTVWRIEQQVGKDLQYIRINGTIVGAVAGLVIYSVAQVLH